MSIVKSPVSSIIQSVTGSIMEKSSSGLPNPFPDIANNAWDFRDFSKYEFASGNIVATVHPVLGRIDFVTALAAERPTYSASLLGGRGGLEAPDASTAFKTGSDFGATTKQTIWIVHEIATDGATDPILLGFGDNTNMTANARLRALLGVGNYVGQYSSNEVGGTEAVAGAMSYAARNITVLRYDSTTLSVYTNDTGHEITIDPDDIYSTLGRLWLFSGTGENNSMKNQRYGYVAQALNALDPAVIALGTEYLAQEFGITLP